MSNITCRCATALTTFVAKPRAEIHHSLLVAGLAKSGVVCRKRPAGTRGRSRRSAPIHLVSLFGVKPLAKEFRKIYIGHLEELYGNGELDFTATPPPEGFPGLIATLKATKLIIYAKSPFAGPEQALDYPGRYTHRVAISNHRRVSIDDEQVTFTYKDRSNPNHANQMRLCPNEFIRRFLL